jgi:hypothetical protein
MVQLPIADNDFTCICKAVLESKGGEVYTDYGDCNPKNVSSKIVAHLIRMASTRAKARVMRDFCNIGICSFDELNPDDMEAEPATLSQITLLKKLIAELNINVEFRGLTKDSASALIGELNDKKMYLKMVK